MEDKDQDTGRHRLVRLDEPISMAVDPHRQLAPAGLSPAWYDDDDEINLFELWLTIRKYKWVIISFTALIVGTTIVSTSLMLPVYKATATIQIDEERPKILSYQDIEGATNNPLGHKNFYATQYQILQSRSLAGTVIDKLDLLQNPEINGTTSQKGIMAGVNQLISVVSNAVADEPGTKRVITSKEERDKAIDRFLARLTISPVSDSKLVNVSFQSFDPMLAKLVTSTLVDVYIHSNLQRHYDASSEAREFLKDQLDKMKINLERADQSLQDFAKKHGIADHEVRMELANNKLARLEEKLVDVQNQKVELGIKRDQINAGNGHVLPEVMSSGLINTLQGELVQLRAEYSELLGQLKPRYPRMIKLRQRIEQLEQQNNAEKEHILESIISRYEALVQEEKQIKAGIEKQENELLTLNQGVIQYNILKREVETNKELYSGLLQRMKEIGVAGGVRENNVAIIDEASTPMEPFAPNMKFNAIIALILGACGGTGLAFFFRFLDNTVRRPEDIEELVGLPTMGLIPANKGRNRLRTRSLSDKELAFFSINHRQSDISESYRALRTSLMFSTLNEGMPKTLLVTSTIPGEGKTTTACNLASVLTQNGERTLLIDADLRRARLHEYFDKSRIPGLTQRIMRRDLPMANYVHETNIKNLFVITSGTIPLNPTEILGPKWISKLLERFSEIFDHVIIDSAPVMGLADALVLSRSVGGVLMVTASGQTTKEALKHSIRRLRQVNAPLLGIVLNKVDLESPEYSYYGNNYYYNSPQAVDLLETDKPDKRFRRDCA